jgi:hypothetical protein
MKIKNLSEVTKEKEKIKTKTVTKSDLEFIPNEETLNAIKEARILSSTVQDAFDNFDDLWKELMSDED